MSPTVLQIVILGLVQGAAELLPVSSSAHVIAAEKLMRLDPSSPEMTFLLVMLHAGTMFAVVAYFWKSWRQRFFSSAESLRRALVGVCLATGATAAVGLPILWALERATGRPVEALFSSLPLIAASVAASGVVILWAGSRPAAVNSDASAPIPLGDAGLMGAVQGLVLPFRGLSRSGTTISAALLRGVARRTAEEFSFALAVVITPPVIFRELRRFYKARAALGEHVHVGAMLAPGLLGMACSFVGGLLALAWLSSWLERGRWTYFGLYCLVAAAALLGMAALGY